jgi:hypothetical protein
MGTPKRPKRRPIEYRRSSDPPALDFSVLLDSKQYGDNLAFVVMTAVKFKGETEAIGNTRRQDGSEWSRVRVVFPDAKSIEAAVANCVEKLTPAGRLKVSTVGLLDHADPLRIVTTRLVEELERQRS